MSAMNFRPIWRYWDALISGVYTTLTLALISAAIGIIIGIYGAYLIRGGSRPVRAFLQSYIEVIRNTPILIQIFIIFFGLPVLGIKLDPMIAASVALSLYFGAYSIEIIRSGIDSIPASQTEAGMCIGLTHLQVMRYVILPPALRNIYPSITSQFILLLLGTSIASQISVDELFHVAGIVDSRTYRSFEVYALICTIYLALSLSFKLLFAVLGHLMFRWPVRR
ncbi:amino acid ABC transporter permease [Paenochrobactrum sp. BZR 588]|uniref:amino acid ABC transporter permease n=1 Tax=unclassified Paenochrobactrum TaxID=2639760 RepID=UPI003853FAA0